MNNKESVIREAVQSFYERMAFSNCLENNFVPWWMHQEYKIPEHDAISCSSDGNFDFGLDGFYIAEKDSKYELTLVQGKFTNDISQIRKGVLDISRFIPKLVGIVSEYESNSVMENILVKRLRGRVSRLDLTKKPLEIHAIVISLWDNDREMLVKYTDNARNELRKTFQRSFIDKNIAMDVLVYGVNDIIKTDTALLDVAAAPKSVSMSLAGRAQMEMGESVLVYGTCKLKDLVELYETRGNHLFDRNVRYYIHNKKNTERGPSAKIRASLTAINNGQYPPEKFMFLHNGVTLFSENAPGGSDSQISLVNPYVLNGCQTIKSAYFFFQEMMQQKKLNANIWNEIPVFTRITISPDEKLWREVAEASNRQNSLSASALRSNDDLQIKLEGTFKKLGIYYERQEESFENYSRTDFSYIEENYYNSVKEPITIESLAQTIVCISSKVGLAYASRQSEIFESDSMYGRIFSEENTRNLPFLILVYNVRKVIDLAVKDAIPENTNKYHSFRPSRYKNLFTRLVVKAMFKRYEMDELISDYGDEILTRRGAKPKDLKELVTREIRSKDYPILSVIGNLYWDEEKYEWGKETSPELLEYAEKKLGLTASIEIPDAKAEAAA